MIGTGLSPNETAARACWGLRRTIKRPARARSAAATSSQGVRRSRSAGDSGAVGSTCPAAAAGIDLATPTAGRATGRALERPDTPSGATTVAATGGAGRRRLPIRFLATAGAADSRAAGASVSAARLASVARRELPADGIPAGAVPCSASLGDAASSETTCRSGGAGCGSGAGSSGIGGAGTDGVSRGGSSVIGST